MVKILIYFGWNYDNTPHNTEAQIFCQEIIVYNIVQCNKSVWTF